MREKDRFPLLLITLAAIIWLAPVLRPFEAQAIGGLDMRGLFYPWLEFAHNAIWQGNLPLWDASILSGYPYLNNPQIAFFYPPTWFPILLPVNVGISIYLVFHLVLAGSGIYFFVSQHIEELSISHQSPPRWYFALGPLLSAMTWMFGTFMMSRVYAAHIGLLAAHAWIGWLLLATDHFVKKKSFATAVIAGLPFGMCILAGHTTTVIYVGMLWSLYLLYHLIVSEGKRLYILVSFAIAILVGLLLSAVQLLPLLQFSELAARANNTTYEFASSFSTPPKQLLALLIPESFGEPAVIGYWGVANYWEHSAYSGIMPILAILLVPLFLRGQAAKRSWFWIFVIGLALLLAIGRFGFLHRIFYDLLPPFRLARAPGRALAWYAFAASVLVGETVGYLQLHPIRKSRSFTIGSVIVAFVCLVGAFFSIERMGSSESEEILRRLIITRQGWIIAFALVVALALTLLVTMRARAPKYLAWLLLLIVVLDLGHFGRKLPVRESIVPLPFWFGAASLIPEDAQRILPWGLSIFDQNQGAQVGLESVFGYNALEVNKNSVVFAKGQDPRSDIYDLYAADYVVAQVPLDDFVGDEPADLELVGESLGGWVYKRPNPFPYTWIYGTENRTLTLPLGNSAGCDIDPEKAEGSANLLERRHGYWRIGTKSDAEQILIVSETSYPGWSVFIDGNRAEWFTAYEALRGVCVPAGEHLVEWHFRPTIFLYGGLLSGLGLLLIGGAFKKEREAVQTPVD